MRAHGYEYEVLVSNYNVLDCGYTEKEADGVAKKKTDASLTHESRESLIY